MRNYVQPGDVLTFTAPAGGVVSGTGYQIGALFVVAAISAAAGAEFEGQRTGVVDLAKVGAQAWAEGERIYWDNTAKNATTAGGANLLIGVAGRAQDADDTTGRVVLNGTAPPA